MTDTNTIIPATGCLLAGWVNPSRAGGAQYIARHYPVFGLRGDGRTLVIEMHGLPATSADLDRWLIEGGSAGMFYPQDYSSRGALWSWAPA